MQEPARTRYQEILDDFRARIKSGELGGGDRLPTFSELRSSLGASQATVERAYSLLEQEGLIIRERGRGIFVAEKRLRELTGLIGYVGGHFTQRQSVRYSADLVEGVEEVLHREQLRVLLLSEDSPVGWDKVDGMLVASNSPLAKPETFPKSLPLVWVLRTMPGVTSVVLDEFGGAKMGVEHLISLGHSKIAVMMQQTEASLRLRLAGYHEAMAAAGLEAKPEWFFEPKHAMTLGGYSEWALEGMRTWLANGFRELGCTALFVQNDSSSTGVMDALDEAGIKVPDDLSVLSFDGTDVCEITRPRLTSVRVPLREIGITATEALIEEIRTPGARARSIVLPASLRLGDSTAPIRS